jgi:hypothetical protein
VALSALGLGVAFTAVVALTEGATLRLANRRLRREVQRLESEADFLRSQPPTAPSREPDALDDPVHVTRSSVAFDEDDDLPMPSAPVYTPGEDDD